VDEELLEELRRQLHYATDRDLLRYLLSKATKQKGKEMTTPQKKQEQVVNRFENIEVTVERKGSQIVLPNDPHNMSYDEAIIALKKRKEEENMEVSVNEIVKAFPFDGAYAFMKAMQRIYGWATPAPTMGWFGPNPPQTVSLEIGFNKTVQIIWGNFDIPGIDGQLKTGTWQQDGMVYFCIKGTVKKLHMPDVKRIADLTRDIVAKESVYRGQAVQLESDSNGSVDFSDAPKFLDLTRVKPEELTFSDEVQTQVQTNLFTLIEHTEVCRAHKIPLKRGVLLEGPYGTGKTLTAFVAAQKAVANGWTFIMLDKVAGLRDALKFAKMYGPAVVFAEDIDRAVEGERTVDMDDILNTIDGLEAKNSETITILTSNHVGNINKAMLRPGRLDAVITVNPPDAKAAEKLMRIYSRGTLAEGADLTEAGKELQGRIPAVIREVVERAKLYAIGRNPDKSDFKITGDDLLHSAKGMRNHLELMAGTKPEPSVEEKFGHAFKELMKTADSALVERVHKNTVELAEDRGLTVH
jgi:transitional endoplasmic reticulum ATPase